MQWLPKNVQTIRVRLYVGGSADLIFQSELPHIFPM